MLERELIIEKAEMLKAVSNPLRLCLVKKLCENDRLTVTYFTNCMEASQSSISQHLGKLRDLNIVGTEKDGKNTYYYIKNQDVISLVKMLFKEKINE